MRQAALVMAAVLAVAAGGCGPSVRVNGRMAPITVETEPPGARVYQVHPFSGERVSLGTTPLVGAQVFVLTKMEAREVTPAEMAGLMADMNAVHLVIEKDGYETWDGRLSMDRLDAVSREGTDGGREGGNVLVDGPTHRIALRPLE